MCVSFALILTAIIGIILINYQMITDGSVLDKEQWPNRAHLFGTDQYGRDLFYRVIYGARYSLSIGFGGSVIAISIGVFLGSVAGYYGGWAEILIMRISDALLSIPAVLLGMVIMSTLGSNLINLIICCGVTSIPSYIKMSRASVIQLKGQEFVEAARAIGQRDLRSSFTQILRTVFPDHRYVHAEYRCHDPERFDAFLPGLRNRAPAA
jgi:peptide/nickel transport system permease protein